ncbi:hypothetical protein GOB46_24800 [Sinorhizobium meliloti]|nr:hypothetical protein [Sinorhizobium meliloti]MDW9483533.1 hypothetical protein [Sinorhizobium meliloti]MDW9514708.1 hypothetical protein [Sinorhizobium meliloti]MDW9670647.1 hypothetical protein [Sinorhizobium meliloti]MDW9855773.1 hypothetical protein [Sinorhizobium meliloti]
MNVIESKKLRRGMQAENRTHFSSSRSRAGGMISRTDVAIAGTTHFSTLSRSTSSAFW